jgi:hypothetical protein
MWNKPSSSVGMEEAKWPPHTQRGSHSCSDELRMMKSSISIFDEFNSLRNNKSCAHDNEIVGLHEARLIFDSFSNVLRFTRKSVPATSPGSVYWQRSTATSCGWQEGTAWAAEPTSRPADRLHWLDTLDARRDAPPPAQRRGSPLQSPGDLSNRRTGSNAS